MAQQTFTEEIVSLIKTKFRQVAKYVTVYAYTDFLDDDIPNTRAVKQLIDIGVSGAGFPITVLSSDPLPKNITDLGNYQGGYKSFGQVKLVDGVTDESINDVAIRRNWTDGTKTVLVSIDIFAHQGVDDVVVTLF